MEQKLLYLQELMLNQDLIGLESAALEVSAIWLRSAPKPTFLSTTLLGQVKSLIKSSQSYVIKKAGAFILPLWEPNGLLLIKHHAAGYCVSFFACDRGNFFNITNSDDFASVVEQKH